VRLGGMTTTSLGSAIRVSTAASTAGLTLSLVRSLRGALGALVLLLALPVTIAFDLVFPGSAGVVIHALLATGTLLIALSVFDFATPTWLTWTALAAASILAAVFFIQGVTELTQNEWLRSVAYSQELGGWGEALTVSVVMAWFIAVARAHCRGIMMVFGVLSAAGMIGLSAWGVLASASGGTPAGMRLLFLLPIAWFLFVSTRRSNA
jgi:hypothetical protein